MTRTLFTPLRAVVLAIAVCLALAALAVAATTKAQPPSIHWGHPVLLENPNNGGGLDAISCAPTSVKTPTPLLCVAGDQRGDVIVTAHPAQSSSHWFRRRLDPKNAVTGVACPSTQLCVAVDSAGQVMHSVHPMQGLSQWSKPVQIDTATQAGGGDAGFAAIACPSTTLCVAVDNAANGQVAVSTDPTGPASAWTVTPIGSNVMLDSVSCATTTFCMIAGSNAYYATSPTGGSSAWKAVATLTSNNSVIASITCNTLKLCIGVGYGNAGPALAVASSSPSSAGWTDSFVGTDPPSPETQVLDSVACPLRNLCVAADGSSHVYTTTTPVRGNWSTFKRLKKASQATLSQVTCTSTYCVEVDNRGTVIYGVVKDGVPAKPSTAHTTPTTTTGATTT